MIPGWSALGLAGKLTAAGIALVLILAVVVGVMTHNARSAAEAKVSGAMTAARVEAGADAGQVVDSAHTAATASEDLTRKNADEIRNAPGASAALDPALNDAGLRSLCRRAAYRGRPECAVQQPRTAQPSR